MSFNPLSRISSFITSPHPEDNKDSGGVVQSPFEDYLFHKYSIVNVLIQVIKLMMLRQNFLFH